MGKPYHALLYRNRRRDRFTVIAHRGASNDYPENTLVSIQGAIEMGADMVEVDVLVTRDGIPVVAHNERISRLTGGSGRVAHYTLEEIKKLDFGYTKRGFHGEKIPTLDEVLSLCKNTIALNIEIKPGAVIEQVNEGVEEKCVGLVYYHGMQDHVVFSGFDPRIFLHLKIIDPSLATAVLFDKRYYHKELLPSQIVEHLEVDCFNCSKDILSPEWLKDCHAHGIPVNVYTVNDVKTMEDCIDRGISGIFTNRPNLLIDVLQKREIPLFLDRFFKVT